MFLIPFSIRRPNCDKGPRIWALRRGIKTEPIGYDVLQEQFTQELWTTLLHVLLSALRVNRDYLPAVTVQRDHKDSKGALLRLIQWGLTI
jgi:hypothetical protein